MSEPTVWLDVRGAARHLKTSEPTILRRARRGELRAYKLGKLWRFRVSDLDAAMELTPYVPKEARRKPTLKNEERVQAGRPVALANRRAGEARPDDDSTTTAH
jgi:excisionase family DNA binding protein